MTQKLLIQGRLLILTLIVALCVAMVYSSPAQARMYCGLECYPACFTDDAGTRLVCG
jgi:hypothetical protein